MFKIIFHQNMSHAVIDHDALQKLRSAYKPPTSDAFLF